MYINLINPHQPSSTLINHINLINLINLLKHPLATYTIEGYIAGKSELVAMG